MKKILFIVGMILCVAVVGSVFAVSVFNAEQATATVTADTSIVLGWDGTLNTNIQLTPGVKNIYTVNLDVEKSTHANATGTFTVVCANTSETVNLSKVTVTVCTDVQGNTAASGATVSNTGNNWTITGISMDTTYYIVTLLAADATATEITNCGGTMTLNFTPVEAQ